MNKKTIITSMAVLQLFAGTINAQSNQGIVTATSLNVRSGPATSYTTKFIVNKGDNVTVEDSADGWYKITTKDGKNGWASSKYIQTSQNTTTTKVVSVSSLNMRSGPSTSYNIIEVLTKDTQVEVISVEDGWAKIKYNSKTGYVSNQYLSDKKVEEVTQIKYVNATTLNVRSGPSTTYSIIDTLKQNAKVEVISIENNWAKIKHNNEIGYVSAEYLSDKKVEEVTQTKYVNATTLNVRSGPSTAYSIIDTLKQNDEVKVISIEDGWAKIKHNDEIGYVSAQYLSDKKVETIQIKYVNATTLNVRSGPDTTYEILTTYKYGQEVKVVNISEDKEWAKIKYNDEYAYVSNKYLVDKLEADSENNDSNTGSITGTFENVNCSFSTMVDYEYKLSLQGFNKIRANLSTNYSNSSAYVKATREDLSKYLNPETFSTNATGKLQFLRIDKYREGITASELNQFFSKYCKSNSVFLNKGQAFIDAAKKYNLDVTYLVAASMVETGYGSSTLAQGVYVTTPSGEQVKVYNFFGISAFDGTAVPSAANYAYQKGWTSIDKTIEGSAQWIAGNYIHNSKYKQNTLYKMRWSYNTGHQYATDVNWANSIGRVMNNIVPYYDGNAHLEYLIPKYK
ncbi:MAG: SH3 domain-containing protein [Clostridiales bacterium]|nr:SH3 domain-containing protein [Clostridiales bacterium]